MSLAPVSSSSSAPADAWPVAASLLARWLDQEERADTLLERCPLSGGARAGCQHLFYGVIRHLGRLELALADLVRLRPRNNVMAVLLLAGFELLEGGEEGHAARVVHHAVTQARRLAGEPPARLVNAVARRLGPALAAQKEPGRLASARSLGDYYSHPVWLVERWLARFGAEDTRALLEWNLRPAPVHARWRPQSAPGAADLEWLEATAWERYYSVRGGRWAEVASAVADGRVYLGDPGTRLAVEAAAPQPGETVLDACAAPGGKSVALADRLGRGRLYALDLPGPRQTRLAENLRRVAPEVETVRVEADLRRVRELAGLRPGSCDVVLLDAPCSNTGVMRHRVDVKWRLQPVDFGRHAGQQGELLAAAARWPRVGGRLVYSTCSIDHEENEEVVRAFLAGPGGRDYELVSQHTALPWREGHDGAGVAVLRRRAGA